MPPTLTAKLKLEATSKQKEKLRVASLADRDTLNITSSVDAHYISQACPGCGHTSKENRPNKGLTFVHQQCGYTLHVDWVGARNIALRVQLFRQSWESTGRFSAVPYASSDKGKAKHLSRYSELCFFDRCNLHQRRNEAVR